MVLVDVSEVVAVSGDDVDEEDVGELIVLKAAVSEKLSVVVEGTSEEVEVEIEDEDDEEIIEAMAELEEALA